MTSHPEHVMQARVKSTRLRFLIKAYTLASARACDLGRIGQSGKRLSRVDVTT